jgi:dethiobiotin synthetase
MKTRGLFITGTDTGVGKTYVTALAAREALRQGLSVGAYKPACSGATREPGGSLVWNDLRVLEEAIQFRQAAERICPQRFAAPLAPPVAARTEGRTVHAKLLRDAAYWWEGRVELLLIEGVGGLL